MDTSLSEMNAIVLYFNLTGNQLKLFLIQIRNVPLNEGIRYRNQIEQQLKGLVDVEDMKITFEIQSKKK